MSGRQRLGSALEALLLVSVGAAAVWVALGDRYAVLMNPKFRWLTIVGGAIVLAMGLVSLVRPRLPSSTAILAFLALWGLVLAGRPLSESSAQNLMTVAEMPDVPILEDPDFPFMELKAVRNGIDDGEIEADGLKFTALGVARLLPGPTRELVFLRGYMACCAADALVIGYRLTGAETEDLRDGEWIVVSGTLVTLPEPKPVPRMRIGAASFPMISDGHEFVATRVVRHSETFPTVAEQLASESIGLFAEAVRAAGLLEELERKGPFTVFAPVDAALEDANLDATGDALREWLSWHIVEGSYSSRDLYDVATLRTIHGRELRIEAQNGRVRVEGSRLLFKDIRARNGVVHLIYPSVKEAP